jgi:hypothetical protein
MDIERELLKLSEELQNAYSRSLYLMSSLGYCQSRIKEIIEVIPELNLKLKKTRKKKVESSDQNDEIEF